MIEIIPGFSCVVSPQEFEAHEPNYSEIYVQTPKGILKHIKLSHNRFARVTVPSLPKMDTEAAKALELAPELNFLPAGKIPYDMFEQAVYFFRKVMELKKSDVEAHLWIVWSAEQGYHIIVPKQTVSKASVSFTYDELPQGTIICVDLHSHNTMGAFYSGTDENNDKMLVAYSGVIGKITKESYEYVIRFNLYEHKQKCDLKEIFLIPEKPQPNVPEDWMTQIQETTPHYGGYVGYRAGQGWQPGNGGSFPHATAKLGEITTIHGRKSSPKKESGTEASNSPSSVPEHEQGRSMASLWDSHGFGLGYNFNDDPDVYFNSRTGTVTSAREEEEESAMGTVVQDPRLQRDGVTLIKTAGGYKYVPQTAGEQAQTQLRLLDAAGKAIEQGDSESKKLVDLAEQHSPLPGSANKSMSLTSGTGSTDDIDILPHSGDFEEMAGKYGLEAAEVYDSIMTDMDELAEHDELLVKVIRNAAAMLSETGRADLGHNGF